jgi:hypothetical protein
MSKNNNVRKNLFSHELYQKEHISYDFFCIEWGLKVNAYPHDVCADLGLKANNFPHELFPIVGIFELDCNLNITQLHFFMNKLYIVGEHDGEKCEIMLRYGHYSNELVVARVQFIHRRVGKMTELYRILKLIQQKYKTGQIMIENVQTDEMKKWCIKNGFVEDSLREKCYIEVK